MITNIAVADIGVDIIEVARIQKMIDEYGEKFLKRIFTATEIDYCEQFGKRKYEHFAARFALKEAFSKAIGTGLSEGFAFCEVGVVNLTSGKPELVLEGEMKKKWGDKKFNISLAHTINNAIAIVTMQQP